MVPGRDFVSWSFWRWRRRGGSSMHSKGRSSISRAARCCTIFWAPPAPIRRLRIGGDKFLAIFLVGGTVGGLLFGSLADKWGRRPTMAVTILMYSVFSGLTFFADNLWQVAALRFLVAMGVGGEWAVAASLVSEIFPHRARAHASGIFHATSVLGTWMATLAGMAVGAQWRYAYLLGIIPALLVLWVTVQAWRNRKVGTKQEPGRQSGAGPKWAAFATCY